jgi:hypothetical protein
LAAHVPAEPPSQQGAASVEHDHRSRHATSPEHPPCPQGEPGSPGALWQAPAQQRPSPLEEEHAAPSGPHESRQAPATQRPPGQSEARSQARALRHTPLSHRPDAHSQSDAHAPPSAAAPNGEHEPAAQQRVVQFSSEVQEEAHDGPEHL